MAGDENYERRMSKRTDGQTEGRTNPLNIINLKLLGQSCKMMMTTFHVWVDIVLLVEN